MTIFNWLNIVIPSTPISLVTTFKTFGLQFCTRFLVSHACYMLRTSHPPWFNHPITFGEGCDTLCHCPSRHRPSKAIVHVTDAFSYGICMQKTSILVALRCRLTLWSIKGRETGRTFLAEAWYVNFVHGSYSGSVQCSLALVFNERMC
jgi:hypothetical protein